MYGERQPHDLRVARPRVRDQDVLRTRPPAGPTGDGDSHHVVCRGCGMVAAVRRPTGQVPCLATSQASGFVVDGAEVTFRGLCPDCRPDQTAPQLRTRTASAAVVPTDPDHTGDPSDDPPAGRLPWQP